MVSQTRMPSQKDLLEVKIPSGPSVGQPSAFSPSFQRSPKLQNVLSRMRGEHQRDDQAGGGGSVSPSNRVERREELESSAGREDSSLEPSREKPHLSQNYDEEGQLSVQNISREVPSSLSNESSTSLLGHSHIKEVANEEKVNASEERGHDAKYQKEHRSTSLEARKEAIDVAISSNTSDSSENSSFYSTSSSSSSDGSSTTFTTSTTRNLNDQGRGRGEGRHQRARREKSGTEANQNPSHGGTILDHPIAEKATEYVAQLVAHLGYPTEDIKNQPSSIKTLSTDKEDESLLALHSVEHHSPKVFRREESSNLEEERGRNGRDSSEDIKAVQDIIAKAVQATIDSASSKTLSEPSQQDSEEMSTGKEPKIATSFGSDMTPQQIMEQSSSASKDLSTSPTQGNIANFSTSSTRSSDATNASTTFDEEMKQNISPLLLCGFSTENISLGRQDPGSSCGVLDFLSNLKSTKSSEHVETKCRKRMVPPISDNTSVHKSVSELGRKDSISSNLAETVGAQPTSAERAREKEIVDERGEEKDIEIKIVAAGQRDGDEQSYSVVVESCSPGETEAQIATDLSLCSKSENSENSSSNEQMASASGENQRKGNFTSDLERQKSSRQEGPGDDEEHGSSESSDTFNGIEKVLAEKVQRLSASKRKEDASITATKPPRRSLEKSKSGVARAGGSSTNPENMSNNDDFSRSHKTELLEAIRASQERRKLKLSRSSGSNENSDVSFSSDQAVDTHQTESTFRAQRVLQVSDEQKHISGSKIADSYIQAVSRKSFEHRNHSFPTHSIQSEQERNFLAPRNDHNVKTKTASSEPKPSPHVDKVKTRALVDNVDRGCQKDIELYREKTPLFDDMTNASGLPSKNCLSGPSKRESNSQILQGDGSSHARPIFVEECSPLPESSYLFDQQYSSSGIANTSDGEITRNSSLHSNGVYSGDDSSTIDMETIVTRIDNVVHGLIKSGKIKMDDKDSSEKASLQDRRLRDNTTELLQNLALLRRRRASSVHSESRKLEQTPHSDDSIDNFTHQNIDRLPTKKSVRAVERRSPQPTSHEPLSIGHFAPPKPEDLVSRPQRLAIGEDLIDMPKRKSLPKKYETTSSNGNTQQLGEMVGRAALEEHRNYENKPEANGFSLPPTATGQCSKVVHHSSQRWDDNLLLNEQSKPSDSKMVELDQMERIDDLIKELTIRKSSY